MKLDDYLRESPELRRAGRLAGLLYAQAGLIVHNYRHARWDAEKVIEIAEAEGILRPEIALPIAAALMHDTGVAIGPYKDHGPNSGRLVMKHLPNLGFSIADASEIAGAVIEHNSEVHSTLTSRLLYDADTLNKAGVHGIAQTHLGKEEFGFDFPQMVERVVPYFERLLERGYYTRTGTQMDLEMGHGGIGGLALTLEYWKVIDRILKDGTTDETEIIKSARESLGIQNEFSGGY